MPLISNAMKKTNKGQKSSREGMRLVRMQNLVTVRVDV